MTISGELRSEIGTQAAWKGFSTQTQYIAYRLVSDKEGFDYYPEDIEDLLIKKDEVLIEAVQVKNLKAALTLSHLSSTATSKKGDGFFVRMCKLHAVYPSFHTITIAHFGELGEELQAIQRNNDGVIAKTAKKLTENHGLSVEDADWLLHSLSFERINSDKLQQGIQAQIKTYVPVMAAPDLAQELLTQFVSALSCSKGHTNLKAWQEKIHQIGVGISTIDGFYKEYNKALVRLNELHLADDFDHLKSAFAQGVSTHPSHIRANLDLRRDSWLSQIANALNNTGVVIVKGVSGQGKTTLCYRYLFDNYPESSVFCVRSITTPEQAQNLVTALAGLGEYNKDLALYIDVRPGEQLWAELLQELQARGLSIPVLISIRDEDYNLTPISGRAIKYEIIELVLTEDEAKSIYDSITNNAPHEEYRTFDEAWLSFGKDGPLLEFVYLLTNSQTLTQRLNHQINAFLQERMSDLWLELLYLVCYAGRLGCALEYTKVKSSLACDSLNSAIQRFKDEYLIRISDKGEIEALHPVRAQIMCKALASVTMIPDRDILLHSLRCISSHNTRLMLMDYYLTHEYDQDDFINMCKITCEDWIKYAGILKTALWLDVKHYAEGNTEYITTLFSKYGSGWLCLMPIDFSGILRPNQLIAESMLEIPIFNKADLLELIRETKESLTSLSIQYDITDLFLTNSTYPKSLPQNDEECSSFGYSLFWMAKRSIPVDFEFDTDRIADCICSGSLQSGADALRGLAEHSALKKYYDYSISKLVDRIIPQMQVVYFTASEECVECKFVPLWKDVIDVPDESSASNQYWRIKMLHLLQQMYPFAEYIDIELVGIDYLGDLGICPIDNKLRMHKDNRTIGWVSEINSWVRVRIERTFRPLSWFQYVKRVDDIRELANSLISDTIRLIDDIYKKGRFTKERWRRIETLKEAFRVQTLSDFILPTGAVDPYCLYSEGNSSSPSAEFFTMAPLLSVEKYKQFRHQINEVCSSLSNFYNQFAEILLLRINKKDPKTAKNPSIAGFNLFNSAKALAGLQNEYNNLFSQYSSLEASFNSREIENYLTLVNMWQYILEAPSQGVPIAYDAKQEYRKGKTYFESTLSEFTAEQPWNTYQTDEHIYIAVPFDLVGETTLESEYKKTVAVLREYFKKAIPFSSFRWFFETQACDFAYLPIVDGLSLPISFLIPRYRLLDTVPDGLAKAMLPCELDKELIKQLNISKSLYAWNAVSAKAAEIRVYLKQFCQVINASFSENCTSGINAFVNSIVAHIELAWAEFSVCEKTLSILYENADDISKSLINVISVFLSSKEDVLALIRQKQDLGQVVQTLDMVYSAMLLLQPYVSKLESQEE